MTIIFGVLQHSVKNLKTLMLLVTSDVLRIDVPKVDTNTKQQ